MKKTVHILKVLSVSLLFTACGGGGSDDARTPSPTPSATPTDPPPVASCPTDAQLVEVPCPVEVTANTTLDGQVMICPTGLKVNGATLEMMGGSQLRLGGGLSEVFNGGSIMSIGTQDCPNKITSSQAVPSPGDWDELWIHPDDPNVLSQFTHTIIEYGGYDISETNFAMTTGNAVKIGFDHVTVRNMASRGLDLRNATVEQFRQVAFENFGGAGNPVQFEANDVAIIEGPITIDATTVANPVIGVKGSTLDQTALWEDVGVPYRVVDAAGFSISNATLTITDGVTIQFAPGSTGIDVLQNGTLKMAGTSTRPIELKSSAATPLAGDWGEIFVRGDATSDSFFNHVKVQHAGKGSQGAFDLYQQIGMSNSVFQNNQKCDVNIHGGSGSINPDTNNSYSFCP